MLGDIERIRKELLNWIDKLDECLEGEATEEKKMGTCEATRMILVSGETLHNLVLMLVTLSGASAPAAAWDASLAATVDRLMTQAVERTKGSEYASNVTQRREYVQEAWSRWCPAFVARVPVPFPSRKTA